MLKKRVLLMKYIILYFVHEREAVPSGLALLRVQMSFGGHFGQPMPIATHCLIGQVIPYQWMHSN
jgi:hypothetical protein